MSSNIIKSLINEGKLEYTNKNSVNARNQKYKTKAKQVITIIIYFFKFYLRVACYY